MVGTVTHSGTETEPREDRLLALVWGSLPVWVLGSAWFGVWILAGLVVALSPRWALLPVPAAGAGLALAGLCGAGAQTLGYGVVGIRDLVPHHWAATAVSTAALAMAATTALRLADTPATAAAAMVVVVALFMMGLVVIACESLIDAPVRTRFENGLAVAVHEPMLAVWGLGGLAVTAAAVVVSAGALVLVAPAVWAIAIVRRTHLTLVDFPGYENENC